MPAEHLILFIVGFYLVYKSVKAASENGDLMINEEEHTRQRLLMLLEDLRMEYTPYYIHYYHSLTAVVQDYGDRPKLMQ